MARVKTKEGGAAYAGDVFEGPIEGDLSAREPQGAQATLESRPSRALLVEAITQTLLGNINAELDKERAVAGYLLHLLPGSVLGQPHEAIDIALKAARLTIEGLPTSRGVKPVEEKTDLVFSLGPVGNKGFLREVKNRALYGIQAAKRLATAFRKDGKAGLEKAYAKEKAFHKAHRRAQEHREKAGALIDQAHENWGDLLSWRAVIDERTTPDCKAANNKNFRVSRPPKNLGLPGMVHALCRCVPGPPIPGAPVM